MHFCSECQNMYYLKIKPVDENESDKLIYYCRNCGNENDSISDGNICVSKSTIRDNKKNFSSLINEYTKIDPTLPRTDMIKCPKQECISNTETNTKREVIYIRYDDTNLKFVYMCAHCDTVWEINDNK